MLSRKKLVLEPGLVTSLYRLSADATFKHAEPLDPGIGGRGVGRSSCGSFTTRMVELVLSLFGNVGGSGEGTWSEFSEARPGNGGMSVLPRAFIAVKEDLRT